MKFTLDWLKDQLETTASVDEIATALTAIGLEVESVEDQGKVLRPFVVAYVAEAKDHPNSDHLKVCKVDAGTGTLRGAPYMKWGMQRVPADWYGHVPHSHRAIDDARGFANVLAKLFSISATLPRIEATESVYR